MAQDVTGTKLALIEAAGELFAEHGLEGTSVRAIAEKASANIAAINYHFGSKENLFAEVLNHVISRDKHTSAEAFLDRARQAESPSDFAALIHEMARARFHSYLSAREPLWHARLVMRCLIETSPVLQEVLHERFRPDRDALKTIFKMANPRLDDRTAELFASSFVGEAAFYVFARTPVLMTMNRDEYDELFLEAVALHVARMIILALGLPEPSDSEHESRRHASVPCGSRKIQRERVATENV